MNEYNLLQEIKLLIQENPNDADLGKTIRTLINKYYNE